MHRNVVTLAVAILAAGPMGCASPHAAAPASSSSAEVLAAVHQFADGLNEGDVTKALGACADEMSIIDDIPPHEWHGAGACMRWLGDYSVDATNRGITDGFATLREPRHVDVTGDRAYVVVPADYTYKQHGKAVDEPGATFTISLQKGAAGWRITGWAWSQG